MCGICGISYFNRPFNDEGVLKRMMKKMKHRGPDDEGLFIHNNSGFGFVRLSILDLSFQGHQPMFDVTGRYMIIHNGEVYNFLELKSELNKKGYHFKSNTDTEVILYSYIEWGDHCLNKFNGMWAFCIYDTILNKIFFSRDRFGIKPLYYYLDNEKFIFASEIPPILEALKHNSSINNSTIFDYLVFDRTDHSNFTFFEKIQKLQHGSTILLRDNKFTLKKWYNLKNRVNSIRSNWNDDDNSVQEYKELFNNSIALRLRSDVPVGVCLSGGLDSSSIVSVLLNNFKKDDLKTFSAIYKKGQYGDESDFINEFKNYPLKMFYTTPDANSLFKDMEEFTTAHAEPIPSTSPYAQFKVMELVKGNVVVTLDGQGADEQLAGYHYFFGFYYKNLLKKLKIITLLNELYHNLLVHRSFYPFKTFLFFLLPEILRTETRISNKGFINNDFSSNFKAGTEISKNLYGSNSLNDALLNHFEYKLEHLLKWGDRNSMWFSIESRVPFLDYRLVEKTLTASDNIIIKKGYTKYILRQAMKNVLPEKIRLRRDKIGFGTPAGEWFREKQFIDFINSILNEGNFMKLGILNKEECKKKFILHQMRKIDINKDIWKWVNLELWYNKFILN